MICYLIVPCLAGAVLKDAESGREIRRTECAPLTAKTDSWPIVCLLLDPITDKVASVFHDKDCIHVVCDE